MSVHVFIRPLTSVIAGILLILNSPVKCNYNKEFKMYITKNRWIKIISVCLIFASGSVFADFKSDIIKSCKAYQEGTDRNEINPCKLYIDGFIDASLLSESAAVKPEALLTKQSKKTSEFMKRAYETRVSERKSLMKNNVIHAFCIPLETDRKAVASQVAKSLNIADLKNKPLKKVLFEALESDFPCSK